ncbi:tetratricopeptide repeat protein [Paraburkholderia sp. UYCP14C]|uniref:tetratricopeptide repeat protein n=1 Tax=Paraburkholderia sp. UYCP14C TaxID=2511130 RepID=UPI001021E105|nr:tetratricopeptide repeat protein [Paraburkholderia sp. UYCP14C]RZF27230.1 tetratricopeptide repeat protein [Paraburkholderia sp. UYCP14C]
MKKLFATAFASLLLVSAAAFAVPTVQQIESAMSQGNWQQADAGLTEVLQAHPNNAHAHYLYAQVLDREGRSAEALAQIQQAKTLDPQIRFTDPSRFAQTEARLRRDAQSAGGNVTRHATNPFAQQNAPAVQQPSAMASQAQLRHGPGVGMWIGIIVLIAAIALVLRWTLRRARSQEDTRADEDRRAQLKRATEMLNTVRSIKLDVKLSTAPGHELLEKDVEATEEQLRGAVETLSNGKNPLPPYALDEFEQRLASLRARADGRPDPTAASVGSGQQSAYAQEAERFGSPQPPYPQQQPQVIVQQGGGMGGGMGGLLTGVLLGEALSHGRDRVVERDVLVDPDELRRRGNDGANAGGLDFGQGSNDWNDDGSGGGIDMGSSDDSGWTDT